MALVRHILVTCPNCGHPDRYILEPLEETPLVAILSCEPDEGGCDTKFAVEVRLHVEITVSTCRLALPSTQRPDALLELQTLADPEEEIPF